MLLMYIHSQDGNVAGDEIADIDWTTDDELEILAEPVASSQPTRSATIAGNSEVNLTVEI